LFPLLVQRRGVHSVRVEDVAVRLTHKFVTFRWPVAEA